jgi:tRNA A-37 threonylcarbamoyl transferase component Bud32
MTPSSFGRYQILGEVGRGGMARVYRALDPRFEREVAVKVLPSEVLDDARFRARFEREAKVIAALEHPAIVAVYDFGDQNGQPYLVMRYMPGGSLRERLLEGKLEPHQTATVVRRLASALDYAHEKGIIHRDLKPGNILFDARGDPCLTDFGIVKMARGAATLTGDSIIGTPAYMSPEQAQGEAKIDGRTDIYSLGVVLFEMLTGKQPYSADTPISLALKHIREPVPKLDDFDTDLMPQLQEIIDKAMAKSPSERYANAGQLASALDSLLAPTIEQGATRQAPMPAGVQDETRLAEQAAPEVADATALGATLRAAPPPAGTTVVAGEETPAPGEAEAAPKPGARPMGKIPVWAMAAAGLAVVAIAAFFAFGRPSGQAPPPATPTSIAPVAESTSPPEPAPAALPDVLGPAPSQNIAAFYYPWYGNPDIDGEWIHWQQNGRTPPSNLATDYVPLLGPYSSMDPAVVAQHFAWLREAGVGLVITSWWGPEDRTDHAVPLLLDTAEHYGLKVAFHIEPYDSRSAGSLPDNLHYLVDRYGGHPAFYRTAGTSPWDEIPEPKALFFLFAPSQHPGPSGEAAWDYWNEALDVIHEANLGLVFASTPDPQWVSVGHFDGLYNYVSPSLEGPQAFAWARALPSGAWYVPSVIPGFSAKQVGYPSDTFVPRNDGATYNLQWESALSQGFRPNLVTITSFNEWHEGTAIEPAAPLAERDNPSASLDFGGLGPNGYLEKTRAWVDWFASREFPATYRARMHMTTTSDWTDFLLFEGGQMIRVDLVSIADKVSDYHLEGGVLNLQQPLDRATAGGRVEMVVDFEITGVDPAGMLQFGIGRGHLGSTEVELFRFQGDEPVLVQTMRWGGIVDTGDNRRVFEVPVADIIGP